MEPTTYDQIVAEYLRVCDEYEEATRSMLTLADRGSASDEFRRASDAVSRLAERLGSLRTAMKVVRSRNGDGNRELPPEC